MSECSCYHKYPNPAHKLKNGKWICVDRYKCMHDLELKDEDIKINDANFYHYVKHKTKCVYKEKYIMNKEKEDFLKAIHTIEGFCWQFRPDCEGCPLAKYGNAAGQVGCVIRASLPFSEKEVRKRIEDWENEKR